MSAGSPASAVTLTLEKALNKSRGEVVDCSSTLVQIGYGKDSRDYHTLPLEKLETIYIPASELLIGKSRNKGALTGERACGLARS